MPNGAAGTWTVGRAEEVPEWALLQRELLTANGEGARVFAEEFLECRLGQWLGWRAGARYE